MHRMPAPPALFDRRLLRHRLARALSLVPATFLLDRVAEEMTERLAVVLRRFDLAVVLAAAPECMARALAASQNVGTVLKISLDEEALPFRDASLDLVVSGLSLQFVN